MCHCRHDRFEDEGELKHLSEMLWFADQAYEGESEKTLSQRLGKKGLNSASQSKLSTSACNTLRPFACAGAVLLFVLGTRGDNLLHAD